MAEYGPRGRRTHRRGRRPHRETRALLTAGARPGLAWPGHKSYTQSCALRAGGRRIRVQGHPPPTQGVWGKPGLHETKPKHLYAHSRGWNATQFPHGRDLVTQNLVHRHRGCRRCGDPPPQNLWCGDVREGGTGDAHTWRGRPAAGWRHCLAEWAPCQSAGAGAAWAAGG